jgi:hypothetical protein
MTDRDFDVHAYDQGYRDGRHDAAAEIERLRTALETVMIGGNHLVSIIGVPHPAGGMAHDHVLAHYGPGHQYDAWCCWNAIMEARAALSGDKQ